MIRVFFTVFLPACGFVGGAGAVVWFKIIRPNRRNR